MGIFSSRFKEIEVTAEELSNIIGYLHRNKKGEYPLWTDHAWYDVKVKRWAGGGLVFRFMVDMTKINPPAGEKALDFVRRGLLD